MTLDEAEEIIEDELLNNKTQGYYTQERKLKLIKARRILNEYLEEEMEKLNVEKEKERASENQKADSSANN